MWAVEYFDHQTYTTRLVASGGKAVVFSKRRDAEAEARELSRGNVFHWLNERHGWDLPTLGYSLSTVVVR